jgi:hypothetical protein
MTVEEDSFVQRRQANKAYRTLGFLLLAAAVDSSRIPSKVGLPTLEVHG